jgi:aspartokinase-like uncharacterized kinase|tara:strand:+ start:804 stop:1391 length:588 start_codon:yes stop_codon:yes gene_type:complete
MVVVKIGGSLQSTKYIKQWLDSIRINRSTSFLIIFGGGKYANKIREEQKIKKYNDYEAHKLAIDAMRRLAFDNLKNLKDFEVINSLEDIKKNNKKRKLMIWMPSVKEINEFNIPLNWSATSDTIALSVSKKINSPLLIIKSFDFGKIKYVTSFFLKKNILDDYFSSNYLNNSQYISLASKDKHYMLRKICKKFIY